eukprot:3447423-Amphidinium_carterae.1
MNNSALELATSQCQICRALDIHNLAATCCKLSDQAARRLGVLHLWIGKKKSTATKGFVFQNV